MMKVSYWLIDYYLISFGAPIVGAPIPPIRLYIAVKGSIFSTKLST